MADEKSTKVGADAKTKTETKDGRETAVTEVKVEGPGAGDTITGYELVDAPDIDKHRLGGVRVDPQPGEVARQRAHELAERHPLAAKVAKVQEDLATITAEVVSDKVRQAFIQVERALKRAEDIQRQEEAVARDVEEPILESEADAERTKLNQVKETTVGPDPWDSMGDIDAEVKVTERSTP